ncbi:MAG: hypothetical protein M1816_002410 [Peltula sp. TS41687]|nr:MAG: hypothetical protein M1816_002410 [Peltula sp. TS41687]
MPGRVSTRTSRQTTTIRDSTQPRASTPAGASSAANTHTEEGSPSQLRANVCRIFADAQHTAVSHRKLVINLRRIQEGCCHGVPTAKGKEAMAETWDEETFNQEVERCILRVMGVKKGEAVGDRIVKFLGLFLRHAGDKDHALVATESGEDTEMLGDTPSTRLTSRIMSLLLPLLSSKEKTVRYRATQLISHIINSVDSIDDDLFQSLRMGLLKRLKDKESVVRVQAVLGLGRLAGNEAEEDQNDEESEDEDAGGLLERLMRVLQNDPSADVRRSLLLNLPLTSTTLPFLLERARDQDASTRRVLYSRLLPAIGDFRHLSLSMREKLLRWGFRDRDENVRKAAGKLFRERWIEDCAGTWASTEGGGAVGEASPPNFDALLEMLERIDVVNSGVEDGVALEALMSFWEGRPDYRDAVCFEDSYWDSLSAESAFMARTFHDFVRLHRNGRYENLLEEKMPEVTKLAFYLQRYTNKLIETMKEVAAQGRDAEADDETVEQGFIVEQLLHIALILDYSDEVGRRKMFTVMRELLAIPELPEEATKLVVEVLRTVCGRDAASEREFCSVVLEAVSEVHDTIMNEETEIQQEEDSFHSARSELSDVTISSATRMSRKPSPDVKKNGGEDDEEILMREIIVNMKCLHIAQCMLENVEGQLRENSHLASMLNNLVVPAVRSHEAPLRERGLLCLGLCCLLDKTLAEENLTLFLHCFNKGHDALQVYALHILCDILTTHGSSILDSASLESGKPLIKVFSKGLKASEKPDVQSSACTAICKLMLSGIFADEDVLKSLVVAYFDPDTANNLAVRQALTYFLPVYCHSRRENQERMQKIAVGAIHSLMLVSENMDEEEEMVGLSVIAAHLVDWTDPRKLVVLDTLGTEEFSEQQTKRKDTAKAINGDVHLNLAKDILDKICSATCHREEKKILASMLNKLYITQHVISPENLAQVYDLVNSAIDDRTVSDAPSRNALTKLASNLGRIVEDVTATRIPDNGAEDTKWTVTGATERERSVMSDKETTKHEQEGDEDVEEVTEQLADTTIQPNARDEKEVKDSLVDELLEDDEDDELEEEEL